MTTVVLVNETYRIRVDGRTIDVVVDPRLKFATPAVKKAADEAAEALASLSERIVGIEELELGLNAPSEELPIARLLAKRLRGRIVQRAKDDDAEPIPDDAVD